MITRSEAVRRARSAIAAWTEAAERDAGFDAGEFSGPACMRALERELREISRLSGIDPDELEAESQEEEER